MERAEQEEERLTPRQREVWRLVAKGHTNGEIAEALGISLDGAKWHVGELLTRFGATTREDLITEWESGRKPLERVRRMLSGLGMSAGPKAAAGGVVVVASVVGVAAVASSLGSSSLSATEAPGDPVPLVILGTPAAAQPFDTVLTQQEAFSRAETIANEWIAGDLLEYLADPNTRTSQLNLRHAVWLPAGVGYTSPNGNHQWTPEATATDGAWAFSWLGEDMGESEGPPVDAGDVEVEVILADRTNAETLGARAQVVFSRGGIRYAGHATNLRPMAPQPFDPSGDVFFVARLNGEPDEAELLLYQADDGSWCRWQVEPNGSGMRGCGPFSGWTPDAPISQIGGSGGGFWLVNGVTVERAPSVLVRADPSVRTIGVLVEGRAEERFPTYEIPPAAGLPYRIGFFSTLRLCEPYWLVAYDIDGTELARQGPWKGGQLTQNGN